MLEELTTTVVEDAESELELLEGLRVLGRAAALCSELALDIDVAAPWFFSMNTQTRMIGGPAPDGEYYLAMVDGRRRYRVRGRRGTTAYLGFQVLAGIGLTPRRMGAYVSDTDLEIGPDGTFSFVLATEEPSVDELAGDRWVPWPEDSSSIVVREYIADRSLEVAADLEIEPLDPPELPALPIDATLAEQFTSMAWTIAKLTTLHRTVRPDLMTAPNTLLTAEAAALGSADTTPDNLYMIGVFVLEEDEALVLDIEPPSSRYWSITLENIWHECIDPRRRRSHLTNAATADTAGSLQVVAASRNPGVSNWLDTGGRRRGFITLRWLDNPEPPPVTARVCKLAELDS
jgi:hypothetical protein